LLVGAEGTISAPEDVLNVETWNELTILRRLGLQFGYPGTTVVQATIGDFVVVPEPSSAWLPGIFLVIALVAFLFSKLRRNRPVPLLACSIAS
jgi:hypothetical protein